jgi:hypothetical protein
VRRHENRPLERRREEKGTKGRRRLECDTRLHPERRRVAARDRSARDRGALVRLAEDVDHVDAHVERDVVEVGINLFYA